MNVVRFAKLTVDKNEVADPPRHGWDRERLHSLAVIGQRHMWFELASRSSPKPRIAERRSKRFVQRAPWCAIECKNERINTG